MLAPVAPAVARPPEGRPGGLRVPRAHLQLGRPLHLHARAGDHQPVGLRPGVPRRREAPARLGLDGRPGAGRSGPGPGLPLEQRRAVGRRRRHLLQPAMRLQAGRGQPHGPDARNLRPRREHRRRRDHAQSLRGHPRRPQGDRHAVDGGHRAAALLGAPARQARPCGPLADHPVRGALRRRRRRGRGPGRDGRPRRRPLARGERLLPRGHHPGNRGELPLLLEFRPQLPHRRPGVDQVAEPRARQPGPRRVRPGPRRAGSAAEGDQQEPAPALLQPEHRRRRALGPPPDRPHARGRAGRAAAGRDLPGAGGRGSRAARAGRRAAGGPRRSVLRAGRGTTLEGRRCARS